MNLKIEFARKMSLAYTAVCRPLCQEMKLPQTAFDILMFLYNNPEYKTARDMGLSDEDQKKLAIYFSQMEKNLDQIIKGDER